MQVQSTAAVERSLTDKQHFVLLDGLRGVAAACVMFSHLKFLAGVKGSFHHAELAVDFFFALSGFVIAHAYFERLRTKQLSFSDFMLARVIRLYPMILLSTIISVILICVTDAVTPRMIYLGLMQIFTIPLVVGSGNTFPLNPPVWSLFFEMFASVLFGLTVRLFRIRVVITLIVISFAVFIIMCLSRNQENIGYAVGGLVGGLLRVSATFYAGVIAYFWHQRFSFASRIPAWVVALLVFCIFALPGDDDVLLRLALVVFFPILVTIGANIKMQAGAQLAIATFLGRISYPLYLLHWPVLTLIYLAFAAAHFPYSVHARLFSVFACLVTMVFAWAAVASIDEPVRSSLGLWRRRRWSNRVGRAGHIPVSLGDSPQITELVNIDDKVV